jgi:hypothetical protein
MILSDKMFKISSALRAFTFGILAGIFIGRTYTSGLPVSIFVLIFFWIATEIAGAIIKNKEKNNK